MRHNEQVGGPLISHDVSNNPSVAVIGSATIDTIIQGQSHLYQLGGVVTYAGVTFRRHGISTVILANVAERDRAILDALKKEGVQIVVGISPRTTHFINYIHDDTRRQEMPSWAVPISLSQIRGLVERVDHVHVGALHPHDIDRDALVYLIEADTLITADIQGYVRYRAGDTIESRVSDNLNHVLSAARIIKADHEELETVLGKYKINLPRLMEKFAIEEVVVTRGAQGGWVRTVTGEEGVYHAIPPDRIHTAVGAGDVFFAVYLVCRMYQQKSIAVSCETAASLASQQIGGQYIRPDQLCLDRLHFRVKT